MRIEVAVAPTGSLKRILQSAAGDRAKYQANRIGRRMVQIANREMANNFNLNRPGSRRRHPGTRRAKTALDYQVDGRELPITVRYRVLGGDVVQQRIAILNYGAGAHPIRPSGVWELGNGQADVLAWPGDDGSLQVAKYVNHPGSRGAGFLEKGRDQAVDEIIGS